MNKFRLFIFSTISIGILFSIFTLTLLNPNEKLIEVSSFPSFEMKELTEDTVSYTHLRAHETPEHLVCRLLLEKKNNH